MAGRTPSFQDPPEFDDPRVRAYLREIVSKLRSHFRDLAEPDTIRVSGISVPPGRFPTEAMLADLRSGDFYIDASNFVRMKP